MDIFRFHNPMAPTLFESGEIINGLTSKMWVERYDVAGEFTLTGPPTNALREQVPIGSFISHTDTTEIMVVENHEISSGENSELKITGRGFETIFENRIVGWDGYFPEQVSDSGDSAFLTTGEVWDHVVELIEKYTATGVVTEPENAIPYIEALTDITGTVDPRSRIIKRGVLYGRVLELLKIDNMGIKIVRPGPWSPLGAASPNVAVLIHKGVDRSAEIVLSSDTGEIKSADYLWTLKKSKNAALLTGKWLQHIYPGPEEGINRRMMEIDAKSVDEHFTSVPVDTYPSGPFDLTDTIAAMEQLAIDTLASQKMLALTKTEISRDTLKMKYREDYDVGDLITVTGDYNATSKARITEYVEIEDKTGSTGYPTVELVE